MDSIISIPPQSVSGIVSLQIPGIEVVHMNN